MKKYKSALSLGDVVSLKQTHRIGLVGTNGLMEAGTELKVIEKHDWGVDGETKEGKKLSMIRDYHISYVGQQFTK